ncbi:MAG: D-aminoacyl-tRNA deacylase, partial [Bacteroidota bacterium]
MRIVLQRVKKANVSIDNHLYSYIGNGYMILVGIENDDTMEGVEWLASKICSMRIFADDEGKMNLDIKQVNGDILIVSQFTLHASTKKGNRPSFIKAARPEVAIPLYEKFIAEIEKLLEKPCKTG